MYKAIVMGTSLGGMNALKTILPALPGDIGIPVIIVQHLNDMSEGYWIEMLDNMSFLHVKEADEKEKIKPGYVYIAPPNYHLMIESNQTFSLSIDEKVNHARPSIDVLFESAAYVYYDQLIGVLLTGANHDGATGLKRIKENGGMTIVQDPNTATSKIMPDAAIKKTRVDYILPLNKISDLLTQVAHENINSI